jgi:hypothetical protein
MKEQNNCKRMLVNAAAGEVFGAPAAGLNNAGVALLFRLFL